MVVSLVTSFIVTLQERKVHLLLGAALYFCFSFELNFSFNSTIYGRGANEWTRGGNTLVTCTGYTNGALGLGSAGSEQCTCTLAPLFHTSALTMTAMVPPALCSGAGPRHTVETVTRRWKRLSPHFWPVCGVNIWGALCHGTWERS